MSLLRLAPLLLLLLMAGSRCLAQRPLLALLVDGVRFDYVDDLRALPGFRELVESGVKVDYTTPEFPALSYPNYYSLMTGRHCDVHQMTGNFMWDQSSNREFLIGVSADSRLPLWWDGSEPLWVTLQKLGKKVFMYYWPGCEVEIRGVRPSFCEVYVDSPSEKNFTDAIANALRSLSSGQADMAGIYYEDVDVEGHHFGPDSAEVRTSMQKVDAALQTLNSQIKENHMEEQLNVLIFSDHGMTQIDWTERLIELDKHINMSHVVKMMDRGAVVSMWPREDKHQQVFSALDQVPNMRVYEKAEIPERFRYKGGRFVSPLTLVADPGWYIIQNRDLLPLWKNGSGEAAGFLNGWHGYDNEVVDMRGLFVAKGPDFKNNMRAPPIRSVDIYNLMCRTLGVDPLPNNGSWYRVENLLKASAPSLRWTLWSCCLCLLGILFPIWE